MKGIAHTDRSVIIAPCLVFDSDYIVVVTDLSVIIRFERRIARLRVAIMNTLASPRAPRQPLYRRRRVVGDGHILIADHGAARVDRTASMLHFPCDAACRRTPPRRCKVDERHVFERARCGYLCAGRLVRAVFPRDCGQIFDGTATHRLLRLV